MYPLFSVNIKHQLEVINKNVEIMSQKCKTIQTILFKLLIRLNFNLLL